MRGLLTAWRLALAALLVQACATPPAAPPGDPEAFAAYQERRSGITAIGHWRLSGKLSIDDGEDGGSGRLDWVVNGDFAQLDFRGAFGKGAWRLELGPSGARLHKADGSVVVAPTVDTLVVEEVGWRIPVDALQWWARGLAAPGDERAMELDPEGRVLRLNQHGWEILYSRYRAFGNQQLPGRMDASSGDRRVKLAIVGWTPQEPETPDE
ncbi:MAG: outer membrane lipoprotein LolB [Xanthomonadales bacterium]|nr:outer membrane lipoprotein LolB [Xanthomonadales bacterium]